MHIEINNSEYWLEESGQGPPVLLLHGFTGTAATWEGIVPFLETGFRVIRIDLPGHGQTKTSSGLTMEEFCFDLSLLLDHLNIESVHLAGYSLGGRTALSFANFFPERVTTLVLESASPGLASELERKKRKQSDDNLAEQIVQYGIKAFVDKWENISLFQTQKWLPEEIQKAIRQERLSQHEEGLAASLTGMGTGVQPSWWNNLSQLFLPVCLLAGSEDKKFLAINKRMAELLPEAEFFAIESAGHSLHVEQPEIFGTIVYDFLSKHRDNRGTEG